MGQSDLEELVVGYTEVPPCSSLTQMELKWKEKRKTNKTIQTLHLVVKSRKYVILLCNIMGNIWFIENGKDINTNNYLGENKIKF
jgi:hypothetical protein